MAAGLTQRQLAARVGVSRGAVQDWEAGVSYPDAHHLQALIVAFLEADGLMSGYESAEAEAMWAAVLREAPRMQTPFDASWWAAVLKRQPGSAAGEATPGQAAAVVTAMGSAATERRVDWGEAPDVLGFVGRALELDWAAAGGCAGRLATRRRARYGRHRQNDAGCPRRAGRGATLRTGVLTSRIGATTPSRPPSSGTIPTFRSLRSRARPTPPAPKTPHSPC